MRSIRRSKRHEDMVKHLTSATEKGGRKSVFPTMRELLCFAAVLGFECERKRELKGDLEDIDGRTFETHEQSRDLIYLIALAHSKDAEVLREENEDACITIFEEYANGGLEELSEWLKERPDDPDGDVAILEVLQKRGYLGQTKSVDDALPDVSF